MFSGKRRSFQASYDPVPVLSDRIPPDTHRLKKNQRLIYFLSNLSFNQANPHELPAGTETGVECFFRDAHALERLHVAPCDFLLTNPDKAHQNSLTLYDWLKQIFSKETWETGQYRDILIRALTAILLEGDTKKMVLVNQFIQQIGPYKKKDHSNKTQIEQGSEIHFQSIRAIVYRALGGFEKEIDDFTTCMWTRLYYLSERYPQKIRLDEATKSHLLHHLMKIEGSNYDDTIVKTARVSHFHKNALKYAA